MIEISKNGPVFCCDECPIVEQLDRRLANALEPGSQVPFQFDHCSCAKTDDEFFLSGYCSDAWNGKPAAPAGKSGVRKNTGRAARRDMAAKKNRRRVDIIRSAMGRGMGAGLDRTALPANRITALWRLGVDMDLGTAPVAYAKLPGGSRSKFKKQAARRVRHNDDFALSGSGYKKLHRLWD